MGTRRGGAASISIAQRVFTWNPYLKPHDTRKATHRPCMYKGKQEENPHVTIVRHRHFAREHCTLGLDGVPVTMHPGWAIPTS